MVHQTAWAENLIENFWMTLFLVSIRSPLKSCSCFIKIKMEFLQVNDLTTSEKQARVHFSSKDHFTYPPAYYWPFEKILKFSRALSAQPKIRSQGQVSVWNPTYDGYDDWAVPDQDQGLESMMRKMQTQFIYNK